MNNDTEWGLTLDDCHSCPKVLVDNIMGNILSPSATCVILTILRLIENVGTQCRVAIPTDIFMRVIRTNREKTAYKYVEEVLKTGLISVEKARGKVNIYSINKKCSLWLQEEVVAESASSGEKCHTVGAESASSLDESSGEKCHTVGAESASSGEKCPDSNIEDKAKDKKPNDTYDKVEDKVEDKIDDATDDKVEEKDVLIKSILDKWNELAGQKIRPTKKRVSHINARLKDGFSEQQITHAMNYVATDYWHVSNGHNLIELAIRSTEQLEKKLMAADSRAKLGNNRIDRSTDKLAVNNAWEGSHKTNVVAANMTYDEMLRSL